MSRKPCPTPAAAPAPTPATTGEVRFRSSTHLRGKVTAGGKVLGYVIGAEIKTSDPEAIATLRSLYGFEEVK